MPKKPDFSGWVTKNDIKCADGVTIRHNAFKGNDKQKVPLVWNHDSTSAENVLGHMILENRTAGVYGYGYLNHSDTAKHAKEMLIHGDINSLSISANRLKRQAGNIMHGNIYEVSLVLAGANPGAMIEEVLAHGDGKVDDASAIIYTGSLVHPYDEDEVNHADNGSGEPNDNSEGGNNVAEEGKTVGEVLDTMSEEQNRAMEIVIAQALEDAGISDEDGGEDGVQHNLFEGSESSEDTLQHAIDTRNAIFQEAMQTRSTVSQVAELQHGITNIEVLFPEAHIDNQTPTILKDRKTAYAEILNGVKKSPFARLKAIFADLTEEGARAKGYLTANRKYEQVFKLLQRSTQAQTVYKKQKLDRDDMIDMENFDVVPFISSEMREQLEEELARAIMVGDGRDITSPDKIIEDNIRPITKDDDFFTMKPQFQSVDTLLEDVLNAMAMYEGSGTPTAFIDQRLLNKYKLRKGTDGRYINGKPMTNAEVASEWEVDKVVPTTFLPADSLVIVNLSDYTLGASKGGQVTTFDDFDIDYNQYKYLIETRVSGALMVPMSAIYMTKGAESKEATTMKAAKDAFVTAHPQSTKRGEGAVGKDTHGENYGKFDTTPATPADGGGE